ncbi:hypothetical protein SSABA_v1c06450 [Spiroplasma sabaudiense Ar-1343]|uniref:UPF0122 protein SSABA_v1c06450 n=1 Tax=Spiroplasma sabaudiense Ar-1343 TaxID=1276257 RepID=W6AAG2_9MOLU|nr:YlxM family DNA-binding protein [Spiroplasma sabaudiense]AHI54047.1 hypothetical protein SSABA_v1c06450 [Spiroplasma sabaudiense Ar-1343]
MINLEKNNHTIALFDIYKGLLTSKQRKYFEFYYFEDFSLQEIADEHQISRAAVSDSLQKTIKLLASFEDKLNLLKQHSNFRKIVEDFKNSPQLEIQEILRKIEEVIG